MLGYPIKDLSHFQLRLKNFYARLCYNAWRQKILYLGDSRFTPKLSADKVFFVAATEPQFSENTENAALPLLLSTYDELPLENGSIDVIICHFKESLGSESFLEECSRILAPEGKIIWTLNNPNSLYYYRHREKSNLSFMQARKTLEEYHFDILSTHAHSFINHSQRVGIRSFLLFYEKILCKYLPFWANKISFVAIKKTSHYSPLPAYLKISEKLLSYYRNTRTNLMSEYSDRCSPKNLYF